MTLEMLLIAVVRIAGSLPVLRWGFVGGLIALLTDLSDLFLKNLIDLGGTRDYQEFDIELGKSLGDWRVSGTWHRYQEAPDRYTSRIGTDTGPLSAYTDTQADQLRIGVTWSGIRAWREGRLFMPLIVKLEMQDAVRGRNFVDVRDVYLRITSFF